MLLFPEGSRGEPEVAAAAKTGVVHLLRRVSDAPLVPVQLARLGKVLPRGEGLRVRFICDIRIAQVISWQGETGAVKQALAESLGLRAAVPGER